MGLTDAWLKGNHGRERTAATVRGDRDGLGARVSPKGKITFQLRYRYEGTARRIDIGSYPLMSLKDARTEAIRLRARHEQGHDPKIVRLIERKSIAEAASVEDLVRAWYDAYCVKAKKGHTDILRTFEIHVFPALGELPADSVRLPQWMDLLEAQAEVRPGIAERILINAKQAYKWGVRRKLLEDSPLTGIYAQGDLNIRKRPGSRTLTDDEIARLWRAIDRSRMAEKNRLFLKLCLLYGCRNGELRAAEKAHFDFGAGVWTIPPGNHKLGHKTGKPLLRPIIPAAEALLRQTFVMSPNARHAFTNTGSDEPMGTSAPLALPYNVMQWLRRHERYDMAHWSVHDLRRTARTNFSTLTEPHVAEIMLGHRLPGDWQVYDHYHYLPEQTKAYEAWAARLAQITGASRPK